jgi:hypothetical protein
MTQKIIDMAIQSGFDWSGTELTWENVICTEELKYFARLVAEKEREACAKLCEEYDNGRHANAADLCADAIRARGQA